MITPKNTKFTLKRIVENLGKIPDKGFNEETPKLTQEQKRKLQEMAAMFENYGASIKNEEAIVNSAKGLTELCELAEMYAVNECGDWFQQDIVKKDMQGLKKRVMEYGKVAKECYARMQQLRVAHEDIGHVLGRYYNLKQSNGIPNKTPGPQTLQQEAIAVKCAWCGKDMGSKEGTSKLPSHTICPSCKDEVSGGMEKDKKIPEKPKSGS